MQKSRALNATVFCCENNIRILVSRGRARNQLNTMNYHLVVALMALIASLYVANANVLSTEGETRPSQKYAGWDNNDSMQYGGW